MTIPPRRTTQLTMAEIIQTVAEQERQRDEAIEAAKTLGMLDVAFDRLIARHGEADALDLITERFHRHASKPQANKATALLSTRQSKNGLFGRVTGQLGWL